MILSLDLLHRGPSWSERGW